MGGSLYTGGVGGLRRHENNGPTVIWAELADSLREGFCVFRILSKRDTRRTFRCYFTHISLFDSSFLPDATFAQSITCRFAQELSRASVLIIRAADLQRGHMESMALAISTLLVDTEVAKPRNIPSQHHAPSYSDKSYGN